MDREIIYFDPAFLGMDAFDWQIDVRGRGGNPGITGTGQVIYGRQPRWVCSLGFNGTTKARTLAFRSLVAQVEGRINALRIRIRDPLAPTYKEAGLPTEEEALENDDGSLFDDGSGWEPSMVAPVLEAAAAGATFLRFDANYINNALSGGHIFSVNDWPYQATRIEGAGLDAIIHFKMPLRRAVAEGDEINLQAHALMVLQGDLEGKTALDLNRASSPMIKLEEWVGPERP